jgi:hypothetical protein
MVPISLGEVPMSTDRTIRIMCPNLKCRSILGVPHEARGKLVRCRKCGTNIKIPAKQEPAPAPPPAADEKAA